MNETYDDFLYRLREQRKQLGLSQDQMAQRVHKTQSNYSKVELGLQRLSQVQICVYIHLPAMLVRLCCLYLQEI